MPLAQPDHLQIGSSSPEVWVIAHANLQTFTEIYDEITTGFKWDSKIPNEILRFQMRF